ncbi:hypothetical protein I4U23_022620 [Adineta vaga]|nr:hypothetical protein I4U23_022620 [Adineta vaga]
MSEATLLSLPVEIYYLIFDFLDIKDILRSIRRVSKVFYYATNSYNRYHLNMCSLKASNIKFLSHRIIPEQIISLTINKYYDLNQIDLPHSISGIRGSIYDISKFINLRSLTLVDVNDNDTQKLFEHISLCQNMIKLIIQGFLVTTQQISRLKNLLDTNLSIKTLILWQVKLPYNELKHLENLFKFSRVLKSLSFTPELLGNVALFFLSNGLQENHTLTTLNLQMNQIGDVGIAYLANALKINTTIRILNLQKNKIKNEGMISLADVLQNNQTLVELDLRYNFIEDSAIDYLGNALKNNTKLQRLELYGNPNRTMTILGSLIRIKNDPLFATLDLSRCEIDDDKIQSLAVLLRNNTILKYLDLSGNLITNFGAHRLAEALHDNKVLIKLDLKRNIGRDCVAIGAGISIRNDQKLIFLNLSGEEITNDGMKYIANELYNNKTLEVLDLSYNELGDRGIKYLALVLRNNQTLIKLNLFGNSIRDEGIEDLIKNLHFNTTLLTLNIGGNPLNNILHRFKHKSILITPEFAWNDIKTIENEYLIRAFHNNSTNEILKFDHNHIDDNDIKHLSELLRNTNMIILDLSFNQITDQGLKYLVDILRNNRMLNTLDLRYNRIGEQGAEYLYDALQENTTLKRLKFDGNENDFVTLIGISISLRNDKYQKILSISNINLSISKTFQFILKEIQKKSTLVRIDFHGNNLGYRRIEFLTNALQYHKKLKHLSLNNNEIGFQGIRYLTRLIENKKLKTLELNGNYLGDEGIKYLAEVLRNNMTIRTVCLRDNQITEKGIRYLADMISINKILEIIDLRSNDIGYEGITHLIEILKDKNSPPTIYVELKNYSQEIQTRSKVLEIDQIMSGKICFKCNEPGHIARYCNANDFDSDENEICYECHCPKYICDSVPDHKYIPLGFCSLNIHDVSSPPSLNLNVNKGYLTNEQVDVIVVCSSSDGLRESVLRAAGPYVQRAYAQAIRTIPNNEMIVLECSNLPCQRILFLPWIPDQKIIFTEQTIQNFLSTAVKYVLNENYTSVAFPAIGCGQYGCDVDFIARTMINHIKIESYPLNITITICPKFHNIFNAFQNANKIIPIVQMIPDTWLYNNNFNQLRYLVARNTQEWHRIIEEFDKTMCGLYRRINRIEHIRNDRWHKQYLIHRDDFQNRLNMNTERFLYHGCSAMAADSIIKDYFNRSLSGENGTKYGCGVYFSSNANYSHVYSIPNNRGERCMFFARVLIGKSILGNTNMKVCPSDYHTTTDGEHIYVTYHDTQAYGQYLIHYQ